MTLWVTLRVTLEVTLRVTFNHENNNKFTFYNHKNQFRHVSSIYSSQWLSPLVARSVAQSISVQVNGSVH